MSALEEATLSPRTLLEALEPVLALDAELLEGWSLADCYRLSEREPVRVELRRAGVSVELDVEPERDDGHRALVTVAGLRLGYRAGVDAEVGVPACRRLAELLRARLGDRPRAWTLAPVGLAELARAVAAEVVVEPGDLDADPDRALLRRDFAAYARLYGVEPTVHQVRRPDGLAPGPSIHYPAPRNGRVPNSAAVYPAAMRIAHRRRMRRYFASLGCAFDEAACPRTVPTPTTYTRVIGDPDETPKARVRPRMIPGIGASMWPIHWGVIVRRNLLPVTVAPPWSVEIHRRIRDVEVLSNIPCDVGMLVHDMGLHALGLHAMPAAAWDELVALAFTRVRAQPASVALGRYGVLGRLAAFFEGPVTTRCWQAWQEVDEPEDFEARFAPQFRALLDELREL